MWCEDGIFSSFMKDNTRVIRFGVSYHYINAWLHSSFCRTSSTQMFLRLRSSSNVFSNGENEWHMNAWWDQFHWTLCHNTIKHVLVCQWSQIEKNSLILSMREYIRHLLTARRLLLSISSWEYSLIDRTMQKKKKKKYLMRSLLTRHESLMRVCLCVCDIREKKQLSNIIWMVTRQIWKNMLIIQIRRRR